MAWPAENRPGDKIDNANKNTAGSGPGKSRCDVTEPSQNKQISEQRMTGGGYGLLRGEVGVDRSPCAIGTPRAISWNKFSPPERSNGRRDDLWGKVGWNLTLGAGNTDFKVPLQFALKN